MLHSHVTCCCRFAVRLEFRALQPSGLLLYTASSSINPANFFALLLQHGESKTTSHMAVEHGTPSLSVGSLS